MSPTQDLSVLLVKIVSEAGEPLTALEIARRYNPDLTPTRRASVVNLVSQLGRNGKLHALYNAREPGHRRFVYSMPQYAAVSLLCEIYGLIAAPITTQDGCHYLEGAFPDNPQKVARKKRSGEMQALSLKTAPEK